YELSCLIWVLRRASVERKVEFAERLYGTVRDACKRSQTEAPSLLKAYLALDQTRAEKLAAELALATAQPEDDEEDEDDLKDKELSKIRKRYADADASGEDYIVDDPNAPPEEQTS